MVNWNKRHLFFSGSFVAIEVLFAKVYELVGTPFHFECQLTEAFSDPRCAATVIVAVVAFIAQWYLGVAMVTSWWQNRLPSVFERALWAVLAILTFPAGVAIYYFVVYRRLDERGQYRLLSRL